MKKVLVLLAVILCLSVFVSCGKSEGGKTTTTTEFNADKANVFEWINHVAPEELKSVNDFKTIADGKFVMSVEDKEEGAVMWMQFNGTEIATAIETEMLGKKMKSLEKDGYSYSILVDDMKYLKTKDEEDASNKISEVVYNGVEEKDYNGKTAKVYKFEEKAQNADENNSYCFYVSDGKIVAISDADTPMEIASIGDEAPKGMFTIPDEYQEVDQDTFYALLNNTNGDETEPDESEPVETDADETEPEASETDAEVTETEPEASETEPETSETEGLTAAEAFALFKDVAPAELMQLEGFKAITGGKFYLNIAAEENGSESEIAMLIDGEDSSMLMNMNLGEVNLRVIKNGDDLYYIMDANKQYAVLEGQGTDDGVLSVDAVSVSYIGVEDKEYNGKAVKAYSFELKNGDGETELMAFYVSDGTIVAIESNGTAMNVKALSSQAPEGIFDVPTDYAKVELMELLGMSGGDDVSTGENEE